MGSTTSTSGSFPEDALLLLCEQRKQWLHHDIDISCMVMTNDFFIASHKFVWWPKGSHSFVGQAKRIDAKRAVFLFRILAEETETYDLDKRVSSSATLVRFSGNYSHKDT